MKIGKATKFITAILTCVILITGLVGCGKTDNTSTVDSSNGNELKQEETNAETPSVTEEPINLSFIHYLLEETEGGAALALRDAMDRVKADNPNLVIEEEVLANDSYFTKIQTLAAGNELPDIFPVRGSMLDMLVQNDSIIAIDEALNTDAAWKDNFLPGSFDVFTSEGKIYGVPLSAKATSLVYYNQDIFNEVGITSFPATMDELKTAVETLKANGYTPISLGNKGKWVAQSCILSTLADRYTGTDWFMDIDNNNGTSFDNEQFIASLKTFQDLAKLGTFNEDLNSIDNMQQRTEYYNKKAAMFIEGAWAIGGVVSEAPEDVKSATRIALLPTDPNGNGEANRVSGGASIAYVINSNLEGERLEAAIKVLKALSSPEYGSIMTESNKFPAVKPGDYDETKISDLTKQYLAIMDNTIFTPVYDIYLTPSVIEVVNSGLQELLIDLVTPEELAQKIQKEYERSNK